MNIVLFTASVFRTEIDAAQGKVTLCGNVGPKVLIKKLNFVLLDGDVGGVRTLPAAQG